MAHVRRRVSARTSGQRADFLWRYCASGKHVEEAVDALMAEVDTKTRRQLSVYKRAMVRSMFRKRIEKAVAGGLEPEEECKPIRVDPEVYEIRWSDVRIPVHGLADGLLRDHTCHYRLYYGEPKAAEYFLGLHAHEKAVDGLTADEISQAQDAQIDRAIAVYASRADWVPRITG